MSFIVISNSNSFSSFIKNIIEKDTTYDNVLPMLTQKENIYLIHAPSIGDTFEIWVKRQTKNAPVKIIICADHPTLAEMVKVVELGAKAYCNSYMQKDNYLQMMRLIHEGQSWFPPQMLYETFKLANQHLSKNDSNSSLNELTKKEKEISLAVGQGHTNQKIADLMKISESTVKTHLTHIYKKLGVKDRVGLVIYMKTPQS